MRILITGITGFVGGHLTEHLITKGDTVAGLSKDGAWRGELAAPVPQVQLRKADLNNPSEYAEFVSAFHPEWVFHLAGFAATGIPDEARYHRENVEATRTLYTVLKPLKPLVLFTSTGLVYGSAKNATDAFTETSLTDPLKPYEKSKLVAEKLGHEMGLDVITVRLFNQIGPRQSTDFAVSRYAKLIAEAETHPTHTIETKFLQSYRDFTDIADTVKAFRLLIEKGQPGEVYNAGSGQARKLEDVINQLLGMSSPRVTAIPGARNDPEYSLADVSELKAVTNWQPTIAFDDTLRSVLDYWRRQVAQPGSGSS